MKVCSANLTYSVAAASETPDEFLDRMPLLREVPVALAAAGHEVSVVQLFPTEDSFTYEGVHYHFVQSSLPEKGVGQVASWVHGQRMARQGPAVRALRQVLNLKPDVIHYHRLTLSVSLYLLQLLRGNEGPAIVAQHHGGPPGRGWAARGFERAGLKQVQRALFSRPEAAERYLRDGLLQAGQVVELFDRSTRLRMKSRPRARQATGMQGSPVFLWYADLERDRDPMTAVLGFERVLDSWPKAQLYLYYQGDQLLPQLRAYVIANPALAGRVHFRSLAFGQSSESIFNSADFLLQTDLLANNGHAVMEAMACGVIPVVSDVPLFRALVDNGRCGFLFPAGKPDAMAKELLKFSRGKIAGRAALVHDWFEAAYSYEALAGLLLDVYSEAIGERRSQAAALQESLA